MGKVITGLRFVWIALILAAGGSGIARAVDCNANGTSDSTDISQGTSADCNENRIPDECDVLPSLALARAQSYATCSVPLDVDVSDLDGDGRRDMALVCSNPGGVTLLFNLGMDAEDGLLAVDRNDLAVSESPNSVVAARLDADDDSDLAVSRVSGSVAILENRGNGEFDAESFPSTGSGSADVGAADLDGDGDLDLATANWSNQTFSVLLNDGNAVFEPGVNYPTFEFPRALDIAEVDGDGHPDIAVVSARDHNATIYRNDGSGTFLAVATLPTEGEPMDIRLEEMDGDTSADMVVSSEVSISVFRNLGRTLSWLGFEPAGDVADSGFLDVEDMDDDGVLDLVVASAGSDLVTVHRGEGDLTFREPVTAPVLDLPLSIRAADLDGDGLPDLASATAGADQATVLLQRPVPHAMDMNANHIPDECEADCNRNTVPDDFDISRGDSDDCNDNGLPDDCEVNSFHSYTRSFRTVMGQPLSVIGADWNGDGFPDLAVASFRLINILGNDGTAAFSPESLDVHLGDITSLAPSDVDADGDPDLVASFRRDPEIRVFLNDATGESFRDGVRLSMATAMTHVALSDIDGDGHAGDLISAAFDANTVSIIRARRDGTFLPGTSLNTEAGPSSIALGDIDSDGSLDMAVPGASTAFCSLFRNKGGSGDAWQGYEALPRLRVGPSPRSAVFVDMDLDGDMDLITADSDQALSVAGDSGISILRNSGGGAFEYRTPVPVGTEPVHIAASDLESDGDPDLVVANYASNDLSLLVNDGHGVLTISTLAVGEGPIAIHAEDLDLNGKPDLVVGNSLGSSLTVLLDTSSQQSQPDCNANSVPDSCDYETGILHDEDGDGVADECGRPFHRGDSNNDAALDISDGIFTLNHLFSGGEEPTCFEAADVNNSSAVDISDAIFTFSYLFAGGGARPPAPGPTDLPCGQDPDVPGSAGDLGCDRYDGCRA